MASLRNFLASALVLICCVQHGEAAPKKKAKSPPAPAARAKAKTQPTPVALPAGELRLAAVGAISMDAWTGEALYEKSPDERLYPASTTKILTALLVIESGDLDKEVEIGLEESQVGESSAGIKPGDRFTRRELLYGLMLKSGNDVAHALARNNAGTMPDFAKKMTLRAHELGALNSNFTNPHGLHHPEHYTTARDLALISRAAMQQPLFRKIVATRSYPWRGPNGVWTMPNHNRLLNTFPGTTGLKTGFTRPAGQVLASSALWGTREVISVVMRTHKPGIWEDSKLLLTYGLRKMNADFEPEKAR